MARSHLRLIILSGPGSIGPCAAAIVGRDWCILIGTSEQEARSNWPQAVGAWDKKFVDAIHAGNSDAESIKPEVVGREKGVQVQAVPDDRRPGRHSLVVQTAQLSLGIGSTALWPDPIDSRDRVVVLDASWTHIPSFPEPEEVRAEFEDAFRLGTRGSSGQIHFVTNLPWDADLFTATAEEFGQSDRCTVCFIPTQERRMVRHVREYSAKISPRDIVLLGLVPGRDDRGVFQGLRSDFAQKTQHVKSYPNSALSTGPGPSRDEAVESVGLWLPTEVLVASGPMSEQVLLSRYVAEAAGGINAKVGVAGGEYRLPGTELLRQIDALHGAVVHPGHRNARMGLIVVRLGRDEAVQLTGVGITADIRNLLPSLKISRKRKSSADLIREVETALSSRGLSVPAVRIVS